MSWFRWFRREDDERQLRREVEAHLAERVDDLRESGLSEAEARTRARREFGNRVLHLEDSREVWHWRWLADARRDFRYAVRTLGRTPGFTALALLTLALGIGSVTVIYSVIHNVLWDPLPYPNADRFVNVAVNDVATGRSRSVFSSTELLEFRDQSQVFEGVVGTRGESMLLTLDDRVEEVRAVHVTPNFFSFMGLAPTLGRAATMEDGRPEAPAVVVLRHRAWVAYFNADPSVVGRTVMLGGQPRTIVGVMPARFTWHAADVWIPRNVEAPGSTPFWNFQARLHAKATIAEAEARLGTIASRRAAAHPQEYPATFRVQVIHTIDSVVGDFRGVLYTLLTAVALLMLIACCNVANMLLARATVREREMTVRVALGAGHGRIVRQLVVESLALSLSGAVLGCALAYAGIKIVVPLLPQGPLPGEIEIALDAPTLLASLSLAVLSALLFGVAPAVYSARRDLVHGLKSGGRNVFGGRGRLRGSLVVAEIALSMVLLLSAGLFMRSFLALVRVDLGFDPTHVLVVTPTFPADRYTTLAERRALYEQWLGRIRLLPGVEAVTATIATVLNPTSVSVPDAQASTSGMTVLWWCTGDYFRARGTPIVRGSGFTDDMVADARPVMVVSRAFAAAYFGSEDPLGRQVDLRLPGQPTDGATFTRFEVIGLAGDTRNQGIRNPPLPAVFLPGFGGSSAPVVYVRTAGRPEDLTSSIRHELGVLDRQVALRQASLVNTLDGWYAQPRFSLIVLGIFAVAGLLLVTIGVYSVMAYTVSRQTQEIAVRLALGARSTQVCWTVLARAGTLIGAGIGVGLVTSIGTGRLIANQLWNTHPHDSATTAGTVLLVVIVALAASLFPARRAMRVDPIVALRRD